MLGNAKSIEIMAGAVPTTPTIHASASLTTSAVKITLCSVGQTQHRRIKISNLTATTNRVAWTIVNEGAATPTMSADPANANAAAILAPLQSEYIVLPPNKDLYLIGSQASTAFCVVSYAI